MARTVVVAAAVMAMAACARTPWAPNLTFTHGEVRGLLPSNGLRFVVVPDPTTRLVEVDVRYEVGAREDPPGKAGLAHLVEHLLFEQQPRGPGTPTLMQVLRRHALNVNAYTSWDSTHFMVNARAELLDVLVKLEATRMLDGCKTISEQEFLREREVVRNEVRTRNRSTEGLIPQLTLSGTYPPGHAYARTLVGDDAQLSSITLHDVCEFTRKYYVPERAVVVVAGGFAAERAIRSIENWFNRVDRRAPAPRRAVEPVAASRERRTVEVDLERPWVTVAWPLPDERTREGQAVEFGIWGAFRYFVRDIERDGCATRTALRTLGGREAPVLMLALELAGLSKLDACLDRVWRIAADAGYGWSQHLRTVLEEAKNRRKVDFLSSLEPLFGLGGRTDQIADMAQFSRDIDFNSREMYVFHALDQIGKLEVYEVIAAMQRTLDDDRARVTVFSPSRAGVTRDRRSSLVFDAAMADDREARDVDPSEATWPIVVPDERTGLSRATRFQLDNGMRVVLLPVDAMPVATAQLIFDAGEAAAPEVPGLAAAAADLASLPSGRAGSRAAWQSGIWLDCGTTADHTLCTARGVSLYLDIMLQSLESLTRTGTYLEADIERWQRATRAQYARRRPHQQLAFRHEQLAALYGREHPYTRAGTPAPAAIEKIGGDDLRSFRDQHYTAANATLVIAGRFDPGHTQALVRETFGSWRRGDRSRPAPLAGSRHASAVHIGVIGDDDPQVDVALLYPSSPGIAGEQAARLVLTSMLGDEVRQIRDELGATYGVHARRDARLGASAYHLEGAVDALRAGEALRAMRARIDALRSGAGFDARFARARRKVVQALIHGSTVSFELAQRLGEGARFGVGPSFDRDLLRDTAALTPAQVKQLLARELDPQREVIVLLGDRAAVTRAFAEAGIEDARLVVPAGP